MPPSSSGRTRVASAAPFRSHPSLSSPLGIANPFPGSARFLGSLPPGVRSYSSRHGRCSRSIGTAFTLDRNMHTGRWTEPTPSSRYGAKFSTGERGLLRAPCGGRRSGLCQESDVHPSTAPLTHSRWEILHLDPATCHPTPATKSWQRTWAATIHLTRMLGSIASSVRGGHAYGTVSGTSRPNPSIKWSNHNT